MDRTPIEWILTALQRTLDFKSRSRRAEYWWFTLLWLVVAVCALAADFALLGHDPLRPFTGTVFLLASAVLVVPFVAVSIRRLHDQNLSGWYYLFVFVPYIGGLVMLWWMTRPGTPGDNRFGPDPLPPPNNPTIYYG